MGAPRSRACEAWAWRNQWGETGSSIPARADALRTMRSTARGRSTPPFFALPHRGGHLNGAGDAALAEDADLAAVPVGLQIPPGELTQFADSDTGSIEECQESPVAGIWLQAQDAMEVRLGQDSLGELVADRRQAERAADIEG